MLFVLCLILVHLIDNPNMFTVKILPSFGIISKIDDDVHYSLLVALELEISKNRIINGFDDNLQPNTVLCRSKRIQPRIEDTLFSLSFTNIDIELMPLYSHFDTLCLF